MTKLGAEDQLRAAPEKQLLLLLNCAELGTIEPNAKQYVPQRVVLHEKALLMVRCVLKEKI